MSVDDRADFTRFFHSTERSLRVALVAGFGPDTGREAAAEALAWGWQNWGRLKEMENPVGYLYRVGRNAALKEARRQQRRADLDEPGWEAPDFEPMLAGFMAHLSEKQRVAVWMVHGLGCPHREVAELLGCSRPTVATHVRRALKRLRTEMGVTTDASLGRC